MPNASKTPANIVHRNYWMDDDVYELGCNINARFPEFEHYAWLHWMTCARVVVHSEGVTVYHRDKFHCDYAAKYLRDTMEKYFEKLVAFKPDYSLKQQAEGN